MKKFLSVMLVICAIVLVFTVSCKNNPKPTPTPTPTRAASLEVYSFKNYYPIGATKANLVGTLVYTDTASKVTTVDIKGEGVTTDFDGTTAGEGKVLKISYNGLDTTAVYNIVKVDDVDISGIYIVGKNTTYDFTSGSKTVTKEVWPSWDAFYNFSAIPTSTTLTYTVTLSPTGRTTIRLDDWTYTPDKEGGLSGYPSSKQFDAAGGSDYAPDTTHFYVSLAPEDNKSITNTDAKGKYLVMAFNTFGDAYVWFLGDLADIGTLNSSNEAYIIPAGKMSFDSMGVNYRNITVNDTNAKNLSLTLNMEGYKSTKKAFSFYSSDEGTTYRGYSYIMKLTDTEHPNIEDRE